MKPGEPCSHPGCLSHISHPCDGCGRIGGMPVPMMREYIERPTAEFPQGSYLEILGDRVTMATGRFAGLGPPSLYWHGGPPVVIYQSEKWPWEKRIDAAKS